jgi:hypothetical protein
MRGEEAASMRGDGETSAVLPASIAAAGIGSGAPGMIALRDGPRELVEHALDRRDAGDRLRAEDPAVGVGADHLAVQVDRAAAHARDDVRRVEARVVRRLDQDEILVGPEVLQDADDLDVELLGRREPENTVRP